MRCSEFSLEGESSRLGKCKCCSKIKNKKLRGSRVNGGSEWSNGAQWGMEKVIKRHLPIVSIFISFVFIPPKKPRPYFLTTPHKRKSLFRQLIEKINQLEKN